ncbi:MULTISPECIES: hypothetical protein [unclassified Bacillus (in: firmicutes)]|uniref:hypothetical protein n=1 Tax=unclassified Bacillus (in: firmicutes) TaxID=185979 RepID=UPI0008EDA403|nr:MULTISPECIES: hypothetical protein [unclassified Bacillus (in: firmicutes)]SFB17425.1 hypothetical protein SAMN02799634_107147 [Bacillus sp. UNCCL13]SFQ77113.1 hypothetical protein SAMN04488577_1495 [Bacillus sp. cl95]
MKKNRYLLCLLVCGLLLYFAVPRISITAEGLPGFFAIAWLLLALFVVAGNLIGILYSPRKATNRAMLHSERIQKRIRQFNR